MWSSSYKDGFAVMAKIHRNLHLPPALRPRAFGHAAQEFLQTADPCKTPFWILFGYNVKEKGWEQQYSLSKCPECDQFTRSADEFTRIAGQVEWTEWPELYRRRLDSYRISFNVSKLLVVRESYFSQGAQIGMSTNFFASSFSSLGVFCIIIDALDRQNMEALLSAMSSISRGGLFPCMPYVAYAYIKKMDFQRHVPQQGEIIIEAQQWVIPVFSSADFYTVPKDFISAAFEFLGSLPECRVSVQSLRSTPTATEIQRVMAPDRHAAFLQRLHGWLATGRTTVAYNDLASWNRMALSTPFWNDPDFCQQEFYFGEDNVNMVHPGITNA